MVVEDLEAEADFAEADFVEADFVEAQRDSEWVVQDLQEHHLEELGQGE